MSKRVYAFRYCCISVSMTCTTLGICRNMYFIYEYIPYHIPIGVILHIGFHYYERNNYMYSIVLTMQQYPLYAANLSDITCFPVGPTLQRFVCLHFNGFYSLLPSTSLLWECIFDRLQLPVSLLFHYVCISILYFCFNDLYDSKDM